MKKVKYVLCFILCITFLGCANADHPIADHTYGHNVGGNGVGAITHYITFHSNGKCEQDFMVKEYGGYQHNTYYHYKWDVSGNTISIYHDKSTYWKQSVRGTIDRTLRYDSSTNTIVSGNEVYKLLH